MRNDIGVNECTDGTLSHPSQLSYLSDAYTGATWQQPCGDAIFRIKSHKYKVSTQRFERCSGISGSAGLHGLTEPSTVLVVFSRSIKLGRFLIEHDHIWSCYLQPYSWSDEMSTGNAKNVSKAVVHLRHKLGLSKEKFAAKMGCSFQTVLRWESGQTEISEGNLAKLWELSKHYLPSTQRVFLNAMGPYRKFLEAGVRNRLLEKEIREQFNHRGRDHLESLDRAIRMIQSGDVKKGLLRLRTARNRFSIWKNAVWEQEDLINKD